MNHRTDTFLQYFSMLESKVREITRSSDTENMRAMLKKAYSKNKYLRYKRELLDDICNLRNVLVHEYANVIISEPTDRCLDEMRKLLEQIDNIPNVLDLFRDEKVIYSQKNECVYEAMKIMHKHDYSQLPIYNRNEFQGLLSRNVISRWIESNIESDFNIKQKLSEVTIGELLDIEDTMDRVIFINRAMDLYEFIEVSTHSPSPSGVYIITEHGKLHQKPLAIITPYDNDIILSQLDI